MYTAKSPDKLTSDAERRIAVSTDRAVSEKNCDTLKISVYRGQPLVLAIAIKLGFYHKA